MKTKKINNVNELNSIVSSLRAAGAYSVFARELEFEMRISIIRQTNVFNVKVCPSKLPKFNGDFNEYRADCLTFFNSLKEKKDNAKKNKKKR